jgi:hypothetical protein
VRRIAGRRHDRDARDVTGGGKVHRQRVDADDERGVSEKVPELVP